MPELGGLRPGRSSESTSNSSLVRMAREQRTGRGLNMKPKRGGRKGRRGKRY